MSKLAKRYKEHLFERLKTPEEIAGYVNAAIEEGDIAVLLLALRDVAEAQGIAKVAAEAELNRENIYRILSNQGNPRLSSLFALLHAIGIELRVRPAVRKRRVAVSCGTVEPRLQRTQADEPEQFRPVPKQSKGKDYESALQATSEPLAA